MILRGSASGERQWTIKCPLDAMSSVCVNCVCVAATSRVLTDICGLLTDSVCVCVRCWVGKSRLFVERGGVMADDAAFAHVEALLAATPSAYFDAARHWSPLPTWGAAAAPVWRSGRV